MVPSGSDSAREVQSRPTNAVGSSVQSTGISCMVAAPSECKILPFRPYGGFIEAWKPRQARKDRDREAVPELRGPGRRGGGLGRPEPGAGRRGGGGGGGGAPGPPGPRGHPKRGGG